MGMLGTHALLDHMDLCLARHHHKQVMLNTACGPSTHHSTRPNTSCRTQHAMARLCSCKVMSWVIKTM